MWWVMPEYEMINRLEQFGKTSYTVVTESGLRFEKEYSDVWTEEEMEADILATIEALTSIEMPEEIPEPIEE